MTTFPRFLPAALAALFIATAAEAQAPTAPATPEIPPFDTARTDPHSWTGRFGITNCSWFDMGDAVLLIDTGASETDGRNLLAEVKRTVPGKPVKWVVMTHLHGDSNGGFRALLPTDATVIVHERAIPTFEGLVRGAGKVPTVLGVKDTLVLLGKTQSLVVHATPTPAHTADDLWVFQPSANAVYVGDLVTPGRCPLMSDPATDPKGWLAALDRIDALHAAALVPTRGPSTVTVSDQILGTRSYIKRMLDILTAMKKINAPEARISGELVAQKIGEYCPKELDVTNALYLYRRMNADGTFRQKPGGPAGDAARPAPKKK
jgi:glyoxylase-like metal-dependent hydrolase (beta-lactamase superfamily II)